LIFGTPARAGATAIAEPPTTAETLQQQVFNNPGMPAIFSGMPATWQGPNNFREANKRVTINSEIPETLETTKL
jgi:hypothetical protein